MIDRLAGRQLGAVREVIALGFEVWLRGGWAMDFHLGEITRPHVDVDWFCWGRDAVGLTEALVQKGYTQQFDSPVEQQLDFVRDDIDLGFALVSEKDSHVVVAGGPWAGKPWPDGMLDGPVQTLDHVTARIITVTAQIEIKQMMPIWNPALKRRDKDLLDIARLQAS